MTASCAVVRLQHSSSVEWLFVHIAYDALLSFVVRIVSVAAIVFVSVIARLDACNLCNLLYIRRALSFVHVIDGCRSRYHLWLSGGAVALCECSL